MKALRLRSWLSSSASRAVLLESEGFGYQLGLPGCSTMGINAPRYSVQVMVQIDKSLQRLIFRVSNHRLSAPISRIPRI